MIDALTAFASVLVNGAVTIGMVVLIAAIFVFAVAPFFARGRR